MTFINIIVAHFPRRRLSRHLNFSPSKIYIYIYTKVVILNLKIRILSLTCPERELKKLFEYFLLDIELLNYFSNMIPLDFIDNLKDSI